MNIDHEVLAECCDRLGISVPSERQVRMVYQPLVSWVLTQCEVKETFVLGINGAQGSGKSTLCEILRTQLIETGLSVPLLSIDDLYLRRSDRETLAEGIHPLCSIRGVPGTHDVDLGLGLLQRLRTLGIEDSLALPRLIKRAMIVVARQSSMR